ncbi:amidohydrolase family protein [Myxococcus sp. MISCRS1]|uniref:amidohydrolase family protein n=1 Tax=Myxococcus sp. MISCRS1 TaxID=2996786 RepID=UPI002272176F|nr:amidohydrolase family protein [Myxococcus sp. MISCRS1]MCY1003006.1 amidohydrolase family protein [Myxococcus sp. MISCRS1]
MTWRGPARQGASVWRGARRWFSHEGLPGAARRCTRDAAALLKLDDRGTLAAGKRADFVLVEGHPAADILDTRRIVGVWHRGKRVSGGVEELTP